ncbi:MAG: 30S ribosomal protein S9, partial [Leptonema sp. (in: bacteria)]
MENIEVKQNQEKRKNRTIFVGRRKTAVARVRIYPQSKENKDFLINNKNIENYFPLEKHRKIVLAPFEILNIFYKMTVKVIG